jgi:hypothetical protein
MDKLCFAIELNDEELIHEIKLAHGSSQCYQFDEKNPLKFSLQHGPGRVLLNPSLLHYSPSSLFRFQVFWV